MEIKEENTNSNQPIILFTDDKSYIAQQIKLRNSRTFSIYKDQPLIPRILRKLHFKSTIPFKQMWYGDWKQSLTDGSTVILFDSIFDVEIIEWIRSQGKNIRIIFWFWNPVNKNMYLKLKNLPCELWAFDPEDCKIYNMRYNTQFYFNTIQKSKENLEYDIVFIGKDKGRFSYLNDLNAKFTKEGLNTFFHIVSDRGWKLKSGKKKKSISYTTLLKYVTNSRAILDIVQTGQKGQTLRAMEALFLGKKLITNNKSILEEEYYCSENIFILGHDDLDGLQNFLDRPSVVIHENVIKNYDFDNWIKRFLNE